MRPLTMSAPLGRNLTAAFSAARIQVIIRRAARRSVKRHGSALLALAAALLAPTFVIAAITGNSAICALGGLTALAAMLPHFVTLHYMKGGEL